MCTVTVIAIGALTMRLTPDARRANGIKFHNYGDSALNCANATTERRTRTRP
jgi:hypothetical protein